MSKDLHTDAKVLFRSVLAGLRPPLKEFGFRASGQNFIPESPECWVVINLQKSRFSKPNEVTFYVNVSACTKRWLGFYGKPAIEVPPFYGCEWRWRADQFSSGPCLKEWTISNEAGAAATLSSLKELLLQGVIPAVNTMTTELGLLGHSGGFEFPQLKTRAVVYAANNKTDGLRQTITTLLNQFGSGATSQDTEQHLRLLRSKYPQAMRIAEQHQFSVREQAGKCADVLRGT